MLNTGCGRDILHLRDMLAREYEARECCGEKRDALNEAARLLEFPGKNNTALARDQLSHAVRLLSRGENDVIFDEAGFPSVMVRFSSCLSKDLLFGSNSSAVHPAFAAGQSEFWIGKYQSSIIEGHACSLPMAAPAFGINFDNAWRLCADKGQGWVLMPFVLRMAVALFCRKRGFLPHGNNFNGQEYSYHAEKGIPVDNGQTLCGSGPATWSHDGTASGIRDLNGNLNEWDSGFRLMDGEIQVIPMDELLLPGADTSPDSPLWRAMDETGGFVAPGTPGTLKYDAPGERVRLTRTISDPGVGNCAFSDMQIESGWEPPEIARLMGLCPEAGREGYETGWRWIKTSGEVLPLCGGGHRADDHAGVFFVGATYPRTQNYSLTGLRLCYHE